MQGKYISGGYYLSRFVRRAEYMSRDLIPDRVLSGSGCICEFFPDTWSIEWSRDTFKTRMESASEFGISHSDLPKVIAWATASFADVFGWPNVFYTLKAAQQARAQQLPAAPDIVIFGLGIHESDVEDFLAAAKPPDQQPYFAPVGRTGIFECVSFGNYIEAGTPIGFEPLTTEFGLLTCSWLCNGLEKDCANRLEIRPNSFGLLESRAEALRCVEYISRDDVGAEPGLWLPWLVTIYSFAQFD